ncbi:MAG TPA: helix-turn-helix transcriptional regulator [Candidatus Galloscillospira stercoripullorum]|nr:helix-turn-helix transcriptional regulator [Candidatus Galloscillospira stercoripullorum]
METKSDRSANVLWVAESNFPIKGGIKVHTHDYYHLFYVRQGPVDFPVGDQVLAMEDGEFIIPPPGTPHGMNEIKERMVRCYEIKFSVSSHRLERLIASLPPKLPRDEFAGALIRELVEESARGEPASPTIASDYLLTLINYLYRHYGDRVEVTTGVIDTTGYGQVSKDIVRYLEAHYQQEVPLQEVADALGFNKNYICSAFKRDSGMTIGGCLTIIRIRKAAELISFSDMNLTQVAEATGFTNLSHFNRIFKKIVGVPPGQYRRMFPADILLPGDVEKSPEWLEQNGFVYSVLGGKKLSAETITILEGLAPGGGEPA